MSFQRGDVVGGAADVPQEDRCYYWRAEDGQWVPFPNLLGDQNDQRVRTDEEIQKFLDEGLLVRYPVGVN